MQKQADGRQDDVFDKRLHDIVESRADDEADCQVDNVAFDGEFFELAEEILEVVHEVRTIVLHILADPDLVGNPAVIGSGPEMETDLGDFKQHSEHASCSDMAAVVVDPADRHFLD